MQPLHSARVATCILALAGSLFVLASGASMVETVTDDRRATVAAVTDDARAIRELAGRAMGAGTYGEVTFYPGRIGPFPAAGLDDRDPAPMVFPLPAGGRLIGSVARRSRYAGESLEVIQDAPGTPAEVLAFYQAALAADGWRALGLGPSRDGGLADATPDDLRFAAYCREAAPSWLSLTITGNGWVADVHLQSAQSAAPCAELP